MTINILPLHTGQIVVLGVPSRAAHIVHIAMGNQEVTTGGITVSKASQSRDGCNWYTLQSCAKGLLSTVVGCHLSMSAANNTGIL